MKNGTIDDTKRELEELETSMGADSEEIRRMDRGSGWIFVALFFALGAGVLGIGGVIDDGMSGAELIFIIIGGVALSIVYRSATNRRYLEESIRSDGARAETLEREISSRD